MDATERSGPPQATSIRAAVRHPGPRYRNQGAHSGEAFRDKVLIPQVRKHLAAGRRICIRLDDAEYGYPCGWLEEVFGGLVRAMPDVTHLQVTPISRRHPRDAADAIRYTKDAASHTPPDGGTV